LKKYSVLEYEFKNVYCHSIEKKLEKLERYQTVENDVKELYFQKR